MAVGADQSIPECLDRRRVRKVRVREPLGQAGYLAAKRLDLGNESRRCGRGGSVELLGSRLHRVEQRLIVGLELVPSQDKRVGFIALLRQ